MSNDDENLYRILGLEPSASIDEVKEAWRELVKVWHPDRFTNDPKMQKRSHEKLKEINGAYEILAKKLKLESAINKDLLSKSGQNVQNSHKTHKINKINKLWVISALILFSSIIFIFINAKSDSVKYEIDPLFNDLEISQHKSEPRDWRLQSMYLGMTEEDLLVERGRPERGIDINKDGKVSLSAPKLKHGSTIEKGWSTGTVKFHYESDSLRDEVYRSYAWLRNGGIVAIQVHPKYLSEKIWNEWGFGEFGIPTGMDELKKKFGEPTSSELGFDEYERIYFWENHGVFCTIREGEFKGFGIFSPEDLK